MVFRKQSIPSPDFVQEEAIPRNTKLTAYFCTSMNVNVRQQNNGKRLLFCMQFVLNADMLFLQRSAVLYPEENFPENG